MSPALAAPTACDTPNRTISTTLSNYSGSFSGGVTHASRVENYTGSNSTRTISTTYQRQLAASISVSSSVSADAGAVFAKLSATAGVTVAANGSKTTTFTDSVTYTMASGDSYIFFAGEKKYSASFTQNRCNSSYQVVTSTGTVRSYSIHTEGGVGCKQAPSSTSLAFQAKALYC